MDIDLAELLAGVGDIPTSGGDISQDDFDALFADLPEVGDGDDLSDEEFAELSEMAKPRAKAAKGQGKTKTEYSRKYRAASNAIRLSNIAVLDFETDPFDNVEGTAVFPFLAVLYSDNFPHVEIWDEDHDSFIAKVIAAIEALPEPYTIYAHNGGKFDFMFLLPKLTGEVMFKGRGLMKAKIGPHELRDSYHIIPDRLANFKKDHIDYADMKRGKRAAKRKEIIAYCINDCKYLLDIVKGFVNEFGMKLSIGQAAMARIRQDYKFERLTDGQDAYLRQWFLGGRVECLQGRVRRKKPMKVYDVNSMYPAVMAKYAHPIGNFYLSRTGAINDDTIFLELECHSNGAFVIRDDVKTFAPRGFGTFKTTIWEYNVAVKHGLISNVKILQCIDMPLRSNFAKFVIPLYERRQKLKGLIKQSKADGKEGTPEHDELVKDDMFTKFLLNNGYGKFAQNPRKYKQHFFAKPGEEPPCEDDAPMVWELKFQCDEYWVWEQPSPSDRFNNVATGASITGAARAELLDAICNSVDPVYCDTDCIVCEELTGVVMHDTELGAWSLDDDIVEVTITGKKQYGYINDKGKTKTRCKGSTELNYEQIVALHEGKTITSIALGPTLTYRGDQHYMKRRITATAPILDGPNEQQNFWRSAGAGQSHLS